MGEANAAANSGFLIPYAVVIQGGARVLVSRADGVRGSAYLCPDPACSSPLLFKAGEVKAKHFAHKASASCSRESVVHLLGKMILTARLRASTWVSVWVPCQCGNRTLGSQKLPFPLAAEMEYHLPSGRVGDVVAFAGGGVRFIFEVCYSHKVDAPKAAVLDLSWVELNAEELLNEGRKKVDGELLLVGEAGRLFEASQEPCHFCGVVAEETPHSPPRCFSHYFKYRWHRNRDGSKHIEKQCCGCGLHVSWAVQTEQVKEAADLCLEADEKRNPGLFRI